MAKNDKPQINSTVTNVDFTPPKLFSLSDHNTINDPDERINILIDFFNILEDRVQLLLENNKQTFNILTLLVIQFGQLYTYDKKKSDPQFLTLIVKISLITYYIFEQHCLNADVNIDNILGYHDMILTYLPDNNDELWWYFAWALHIKASSTNDEDEDEDENKELVSRLLTCLDHIENKKCLVGVTGFILKILEKGLFYPEDTIFETLHTLHPEKLYGYESYAGQIQDIYIRTHHINKDYLIYNKTAGLDEASTKRSIDLYFSETIDTKTISIKATISHFDLIRFAAHLRPPSKPKIKIVETGLNENDEHTLNIKIRENLRNKEFCNSEGMITDKLFTKIKDTAKYEHVYEVSITITECYDHFVNTQKMRYLNGRDQFIQDLQTFLPENEARHNEIESLREKIAGFDRLQALLLLHRSLQSTDIDYLDRDNINRAIQILSLCIVFYDEIKTIFKNETRTKQEKHNLSINHAKKIVQKVIEGNDILIVAGTPIKEKNLNTDNSYSMHAIYVTLQRTSINNKPVIRVSITNGGTGMPEFHTISADCNPKDIGSLRYKHTGFECILNKENKEALIQYVYRVITLQFEISAKKPKKGKDITNTSVQQSEYKKLNEHLKNIYLCSKDDDLSTSSFYRKNGEQCTLFKRKDYERDFREQMAGTCTVYNCIRAIKFLLSMEELEFGHFQHTLTHGFDNYISELKGTQKLPTFSLKR